MRITILALFSLCFVSFIYSQTSTLQPPLNLGFEFLEQGKPRGWAIYGGEGYQATTDSSQLKSGKYSACLEYKEGQIGFKSFAYTLPFNYQGNKITLSGYIKTEDVSDGFASLWMRIDPSVGYKDMSNQGITGTMEWTRYEISMDLDPEITTQIDVGGYLSGKGTMWLDDLSVTIDGTEIQYLKPHVKKGFAADKDTSYDTNSKIDQIFPDPTKLRNLKVLGLIWGFLKYYHPNIAKGEYNWDYDLFRVLPKVLAVVSNEERDVVLLQWIKGLGEFQQGHEYSIDASTLKSVPDLDWIDQSGFSDSLVSLLHQVKTAQRRNQHYYIGLQAGVGNPIFKNEKPYYFADCPDTGYRILSLFRYWNIIQYFFPYKHLIGQDWKNVLDEFIPKFIEAKNKTEYNLIVLELIANIHDTHTSHTDDKPGLNDFLGLNIAAIELTYVENKPVVTGYYDDELGKETGLEIGDILTKVNNLSVEELVLDKIKYTPASNYPTLLRDMALRLLRTNDPFIHIEFIRNNSAENQTIKTYPINEFNLNRKYESTDTSFKLIYPNIAYINNSSVKKNHLSKIWKEIKNSKGLIIDNRNYPFDFPIYELTRYLMPDRINFARFSIGSLEMPGTFIYTPSIHIGNKTDTFYKGKVVILINELSQSSSEFHAMAYRVHPNAVVIGSTTAGADGNISQFYLPGGITTKISGIGVYYPDYRETQRVGIVPDIEIKPTIQGIKEGRDEILEKAIKVINED